MHTSEILRKGIFGMNGNNVGKVVDIDISLPQWTINHIVLKSGIACSSKTAYLVK
jgi:sporulation protein YlmC with PRC-barrel domain